MIDKDQIIKAQQEKKDVLNGMSPREAIKKNMTEDDEEEE